MQVLLTQTESTEKQTYELSPSDSKTKPLRIGFLRNAVTPDINARCLAALASLHGISFFYFTPESVDMEKKRIQGIFWENGSCIKREVSYPDIVDSHLGATFRTKHKKIARELMLDLSRSCLKVYTSLGVGKSKINTLLAHNDLSRYLTKTYRCKNINIDTFLDRHKQVILKPDRGNQGKNIYKLSKHKDLYLLQLNDVAKQIPAAEFHAQYAALFYDTFVAQPYINSVTSAGNPFDVRIDVRRGADAHWTLVKMYARIGRANHIASNLAQGGHTLEIVPFLRAEFPKDHKALYEQLLTLSKNIPQVLQQQYRNLIDALGIDVVIDRTNCTLKLCEVNTFPGTKTFPFEAAEVKIQYYKYLIANFDALYAAQTLQDFPKEP